MSDEFPKAERIAYGLRYESVLLPILTKFLGDTITKTKYCYSLLDFVGIRTLSELKVRTSLYHYLDECMKEGWLIPACKILEAWRECDSKEIWFFYLWEQDGSLFALKFDPEYFETLVPRTPSWHQDNQLHYYVPMERWTKIATLKIDPELCRNNCHIQDEEQR